MNDLMCGLFILSQIWSELQFSGIMQELFMIQRWRRISILKEDCLLLNHDTEGEGEGEEGRGSGGRRMPGTIINKILIFEKSKNIPEVKEYSFAGSFIAARSKMQLYGTSSQPLDSRFSRKLYGGGVLSPVELHYFISRLSTCTLSSAAASSTSFSSSSSSSSSSSYPTSLSPSSSSSSSSSCSLPSSSSSSSPSELNRVDNLFNFFIGCDPGSEVESLYPLRNRIRHDVKNRKKRKDEENELRMMKNNDRHKDILCQGNSLRNIPCSAMMKIKDVVNNNHLHLNTGMFFSNRNILCISGDDDDDDNDDDDNRRETTKDSIKDVDDDGLDVRAKPYSTSNRSIRTLKTNEKRDMCQRTGITDLMPLSVQLEISVSQPLQEIRAAELYAAVNSLRHSHGLKSHLRCKYCTVRASSIITGYYDYYSPPPFTLVSFLILYFFLLIFCLVSFL